MNCEEKKQGEWGGQNSFHRMSTNPLEAAGSRKGRLVKNSRPGRMTDENKELWLAKVFYFEKNY